MPKDFNTETNIEVEWKEDQPFAVPVTQFDYSELDNDIESEYLDFKNSGGTLKKFIDVKVQEGRIELQSDILRRAFSMVLEHTRVDLAVFQLAFAFNLLGSTELTMPELAKRFGISKQAFQQGVTTFTDLLQSRKTSNMRTDTERELMSKRNYRRASKTKTK